MITKYYLFGGSGHGRVVADVLNTCKIPVSAILDDFPKANNILGIPLIAAAGFVPVPHDRFIITIGNNSLRKKIVENKSFFYFNAVAPSATISRAAEIGEGSMVMPQVVVNAGSKIGKHCILNSGSVVEHDCILEDYVHISPNAALAGHVRVGEGSQIGLGAQVIQSLKIGKWATIGAGAVIIRDVPDYAVVVGNPGRIIKFNEPS